MNWVRWTKVFVIGFALACAGFVACGDDESSSRNPAISEKDWKSSSSRGADYPGEDESGDLFIRLPVMSEEELASGKDCSSDNTEWKFSNSSVEIVSSSSIPEGSSSSAVVFSSSSLMKNWPPENLSAGSIYDSAANTLTDLRDSQVYRTIHVVGEESHYDRVWMAENLNYAYLQETSTRDSSSFCYDNDPVYCKCFGRLYLYSAATDSAAIFRSTGKGCGYGGYCFVENKPNRGTCPSGWHLPDTLEMIGLPMSDTSVGRFNNGRVFFEGGSLTDFEPMPAGQEFDEKYIHLDKYSVFWTWGEYNSSYSFVYRLDHDSYESLFAIGLKNYSHSVRCVKDVDQDAPFVKDTWYNLRSDIQYGSFVDERDGQEYKTIDVWAEEIGTNRTWMAENLMFDYQGTVTGVPTKFSNDSSYARYGLLYTLQEALDGEGLYEEATTDTVRGICPEGWHLPLYSEFESLIAEADGERLGAFRLNSTKGWDGRLRGTDKFGFSAVPERYLGNYSGIWSSSKKNELHYVAEFTLQFVSSQQKTVHLAVDQGHDYTTHFVRCVKNRQRK